ncbi:major facilitator superfamily domain-containing protein 1 isoform X7 [Onychostruthus taczanowskii]|uniref:major facilitator superfamily domain-containing protein 1 isoform X7 n=1 Tax=Onychostruthus taczanowskii TaxID=356909 RepID=UPI001B800635|nr:major facilitator superfamily domain-containing protein 1 isoform X7 [Onychostruthus taczanowskii]
MADEQRALLGGDGGDGGGGSPGPPRALPAACDPRRLPHRLLVLALMCFLGFGSYFCYDNPAALQTQVQRDMKVNTAQFMALYAWYSWPNVVLCFFGGFLIDRVFGIRLGTVIFSSFVCVGQVVFALGALFNTFWLMEVGRFIFGIGGESLAVAQNTYAVSWFKGKELNLVFGLQLSMARIGSTVNMNIMGWIYSRVQDLLGYTGPSTLGLALLIGGVTCLFSLSCALILAYLDRRAEKLLCKEQGKTGEVIKLTDVKDFSLSLWLIFVICVCYYAAVFPFIGLGKVFFIEKFRFSSQEASAINSIVYIISAPMSPVFGLLVDKVGKNIIWVLCAVVTTLASHIMLAFTFWNPWIAMLITVTQAASDVLDGTSVKMCILLKFLRILEADFLQCWFGAEPCAAPQWGRDSQLWFSSIFPVRCSSGCSIRPQFKSPGIIFGDHSQKKPRVWTFISSFMAQSVP